jgi:preprotein translocase subunit YajC
MSLKSFDIMLAQATSPAAAPATATGTGTPAPSGNASMLVNLVPFLLMFAVLYLLLIRPQSKKAKAHAALVSTLKPGDKVVTSSGIVGIVVSVKDKTVAIRSVETKLEVLKSAVTEVTERSGEASAVES